MNSSRDCSFTVLAARFMMAFMVPCIPSTSLCTHCSTIPTYILCFVHDSHLVFQIMAVLIYDRFEQQASKFCIGASPSSVKGYLVRSIFWFLPREMISPENMLCQQV